jgi:hypothetical protein
MSESSETDVERYHGFSRRFARSLCHDIEQDPAAVFNLEARISAPQKVTIEIKFRVEQLTLANRRMTNQEMATAISAGIAPVSDEAV